MADIDLTDLTNATTADDGTGVFDVLINAAERHIEDQYTQGRITGTDFATVYLGMMQSAITESIKFLLSEQEAGHRADLVAQQVISETKNNETDGVIDKTKGKLDEEIQLLLAQTAEMLAGTIRKDAESAEKVLLLEAQTLGFKSDTKQKILKLMLDGYAVNLSIAGSANVPETVLDGSIDQLSQEILTENGSSVTIQSTPETAEDETATP